MASKVIYVTIESNDPGPENLLAWRNLEATDDGKVYVYELVDTIDKRTVSEVRRKGSKKWFKPEAGA